MYGCISYEFSVLGLTGGITDMVSVNDKPFLIYQVHVNWTEEVTGTWNHE